MQTRRDLLGSTVAASAALGASELAVTPAAGATPDRRAQWEPGKTWVFAVGVLVYPSGQAWPEQGRRDADMIKQLQACGVPAGQISFIKDRSATLAAVRKAFEAHMVQASEDATLWFYFAGHGLKNEAGVSQFALHDESWPVPDVFSVIERRFPGKTALLFADCCYSGSLGMEAMLRAGRVSYGAITSSLASTVSTGSWTFTECLISGLRGAVPVDAGGDGMIRFADLARFAEREMAFNEGQLSTFVTTNGFDPGFVLVPGSRRAHPRIGEYVEARSTDGRWYPGRIDRVDGSKLWIRWVGYKESENEWVENRNTRSYAPKQHPAGTRVQVQWKGTWYPAHVLASRWGMHLIHYDDFEPHWDEWVAPKRMRVSG